MKVAEAARVAAVVKHANSLFDSATPVQRSILLFDSITRRHDVAVALDLLWDEHSMTQEGQDLINGISSHLSDMGDIILHMKARWKRT